MPLMNFAPEIPEDRKPEAITVTYNGPLCPDLEADLTAWAIRNGYRVLCRDYVIEEREIVFAKKHGENHA